MPDIFLYSGEANPTDIKLRDPTTFGAGTNVTADMVVTEGADTTAFTASEIFTGTLAATEGADVLAASASEKITGTLAVTEGADLVAASGSEKLVSTLAVTEGADIFAATSAESITSTLAATEGADIVAAAASVSLSSTIAVTEGADVFTADSPGASAGTAADLAVVEGVDVFAADSTNTSVDEEPAISQGGSGGGGVGRLHVLGRHYKTLPYRKKKRDEEDYDALIERLRHLADLAADAKLGGVDVLNRRYSPSELSGILPALIDVSSYLKAQAEQERLDQERKRLEDDEDAIIAILMAA